MIIIMSVSYLYGQALEMEVAKIETFKVLGLWKFYLCQCYSYDFVQLIKDTQGIPWQSTG